MSRLDHHDDSIVSKIHAVFQQAYRKEAELIGALDFPPLKRTLRDLKATHALFFGCWKDDELSAVTEITSQGSELSIDGLVVDPSHFRKGLASEMLRFVLDSLEWKTAVVETAEANRPAIALYEKFGFEVKSRMISHGIAKVRLRIDPSQSPA